MTIVRKNPPTVAAPVGAYSHLAIVPANSELLVLAGQIGVDENGHIPEAAAHQLENAFKNARAILASEGLGPDSVIKVNIWLVDEIERAHFQEIWARFHEGVQSPTTLAYARRLARPEIKVEVEVWAARPAKT